VLVDDPGFFLLRRTSGRYELVTPTLAQRSSFLRCSSMADHTEAVDDFVGDEIRRVAADFAVVEIVVLCRGFYERGQPQGATPRACTLEDESFT